MTDDQARKHPGEIEPGPPNSTDHTAPVILDEERE